MFKHLRLLTVHIPLRVKLLLFCYILIDILFSTLAIITIIPLGDLVQNITENEYSTFTNIIKYLFKSIGISLDIFSASMLFIGANFIKPFSNLLLQYAIIKLKYIFLYGILNDFLVKLFKTKWTNIEKISIGVIVNVLTKEIHSLGDGLSLLITRFVTIIQFLTYLIVPFYVDSTLTTLVIIGFTLISLPFIGVSWIGKRFGQDNLRSINELMGYATELTRNLKSLYASNNGSFAIKKFNKYFGVHLTATLKAQLFDKVIAVFFRPFALSVVIAVLIYRFTYDTQITPVITILWSLISIIPILNQLIQNRLSFSVFEPSFNQVHELMRSFQEVEIMLLTEAKEVSATNIKVENVSYKISESDILQCIHMEIREGEFTCIAGPSGCGKSTLLDIIIGLREANSGNVYINGTLLSAGDYFGFRNGIGFVGQDTAKVTGSILDNILWKDVHFSDTELTELIAVSKCDFIYDLPMQFETIVGENGVQLSGGQWQRLGILRALIGKPNIIILDEATSALDQDTEVSLVSGLKTLPWRPTILMISHRQGCIDLADKVIRLGK